MIERGLDQIVPTYVNGFLIMPTPTIQQTLEYVRKSPRFQERTAEDKKFIEESLRKYHSAKPKNNLSGIFEISTKEKTYKGETDSLPDNFFDGDFGCQYNHDALDEIINEHNFSFTYEDIIDWKIGKKN